ncbi:MAG TPA: MlaD family protein [Steroidobacteraceae bacterium]|jgi:paraquat-inducible protein B|nr:MlaD family protein [Steroidobacteraceae bacterium]
MSDTPGPGDFEDLPTAVPARSAWGRLPLVWILPAVVIFAGGFVVIREKIAQGTSIEIRFENAEALEANKTKVRYKDVEIGEVRDIRVGADRKEVIVTADIHRNAKSYLVDDTRFWVVRPRISGAGVSGLATLVSGAYISVDVGHSAVSRDHFVGLEVPPIVTADLPGREFVLHADDLGSLDIGSSVFYRHITAGQVVGYSLDPGGTGVTIKVFINAPFDMYVTGQTHFWQASGIDMSVNADGVKLHTESLASILEGGVAFGTLPGAAAPRMPADTAFTLYGDEERAMRPSETEIRSFVMYFGGSLRGLSAGAPVDLQGITVGEVKSVDVEYDQRAGTLSFPVVVELYPRRLRGHARPAHAGQPGGEAESRALIDSLVTHGLRAELKTGNLLTGQKFVSLDMHRDVPKARVVWTEQAAVFPTVSSGLDDIQDSVGVIAKKLSKVPFDQLSARLLGAMSSLDQTLKSADRLLHNVDSNLAPQVQTTLAEAQAALKNAKELLGQDAPLENDLGSTLLQVSRAAKSISALVDYLERHPESLLRGKPAGTP